ncbi:putative quinol monooxygenase [Pedobacter punctiformis]|uniref:Quinol monooxygenase n=1 Tax=Pedobacter punctiformis TaxID=3004097 RepID=A0ABT4L530_9SPHI|nr:putative quinol monooxygenase [Pedobacter sp. HCMS5-2]MCZ4243024.1 putative quinol monooxygenase [Pedobacter sp. HCMS5-2]
MSIYLTVTIKGKTEKTEALKSLLLDMVVNSRKETACLQYDLHHEVEENIFIFHEEWADQAGLDAHNEQSYIKAFVEKSKDLADDIVIYSTKKLA